MKRSSDDQITRVYAYGALAPTEGFDAAMAEVQRQYDLWDALVDIDRDHERRTEECASADNPQIGECRERISAANEEIRARIDARNQERKRARAKVPTPELDAQIRALSDQRRSARRELWSALATWRKEHNAIVQALENERRAAVKSARQLSPCYWGNIARLLDDYERARKLVRKRGRALRHADRTRPNGVLHISHPAFNVRRQTGDPTGLPLEAIMAGHCRALRIAPVDPRAWDNDTPRGERRRLCRTELTIRVDAMGNTMTLPLMLHRAPPAGSRVKCAQLVWRREAERLRFRLCLTLAIANARPQHQGTSACGIDLGWRRLDDGSLLVATLASTISSVVRRYTLPADWMAGMDTVERLSGYIDDETLRLAHQVALDGVDHLPGALREPLSRWRPGLGARHVDCQGLHDAVRALNFDVPEAVRHWYRRYRHLLLYRDNLRAKLLRRRRELYRLCAREIALSHHTITLEELDLSAMARTKKRADHTDSELPAPARAQRQRACVHQLRDEIEHQSKKHGAEIVQVTGPSTMACRQCGQINRPLDRAARHWCCEGCQSVFDQDVNAAANLLAASTGERFGEAVVQEWQANGLRARVKT